MMKALATCLVLLAARVDAAPLYAKAAGGNWSTASTWSAVGCADSGNDGPPTTSTDVIIEACAGPVVVSANVSGRTVAIAPGASVTCQNATSGLVTLGLTLTVTGTIWQADAASTVDMRGCVIALADSGVAGQVTTFAGGSKDYGTITANISVANTLVFTGANTFQKFNFSSNLPTGNPTVTFPAGVTNTVQDWFPDTVTSIFGHFYTFSSDTPGMPTTLSKPNGTINILSTVLVDMVATGGASWCDGYVSADGGGNTGWRFTACPYDVPQLLMGAGR